MDSEPADRVKAHRRVVKSHTDRLAAMGHKKVTLWLTPQGAAMLSDLAPRYGSARAVFEAGMKLLVKPKKEDV